MKTVNRFFLLLIVFGIFSCQNETKIKKSLNKNFAINYSRDSILYNLNVTDSYDTNYFQNQEGDWNETILLEKKLFVKDSNFGGLENMPKAIDYAKKIKVDSPFDCYVLNSIEIETKKNIFKPVWIWKQNFFWGNNEFGEWAGRIELDEAVFEYNKELKNGIKIIYKLNDTNGYKLNILNFVSNGDYWELVSREFINAMPEENIKEQKGYNIDTINNNCQKKFKKGKEIFINDEMMFDLNNSKHY